MFKKVCRYDDEVLFYFDEHDCKYVAMGGSIAWRTNNPGLIHSRDHLSRVYKAIGSYQQVAIFPSLRQGIAAFRARMYSPKFRSSLLEIAKYYRPNDPDLCAEEICKISNFHKNVPVENLTTDEFERIIQAIEHITGFHDNKGFLTALPKITACYHPSGGDLDLYVLGSEELVSKDEAICRIQTHRVDAVIVHKGNGTVYLRSRPGHHLACIRFSNDELNKQADFKDVIRDTGEVKPGQYIWGYINGINNTPDDARKTIQVISKLTNGERVWSLVNDKKILLSLGNVWDSCFQKLNLSTEVAKFAVLFFKFLLNVSSNDPSHPPVIIFAHSQGAIISSVALQSLTQQERQQIRIFTFGGGSFVFPGEAHSESHNYISIGDAVPRFAVENSLALLAIRQFEGKNNGLSDEQIIENLITEDIDNNLSTIDPQAILIYRSHRYDYYVSAFNKITNTTVLDDERQGLLEHSINIPCYRKKIKELIDCYNERKVSISMGDAHVDC